MIDPKLLEAAENASTQLSLHLKARELCLVVGAGVSVGQGVPLWGEFVRRCCERAAVSPPPDGAPVLEHLERMERVKEASPDPGTYRSWIRDALYRDVASSVDAIGDPLLAAIGALLMGSTRGSVADVVTYNLDDVLERYLALHGFTVRPVSALPYLKPAGDAYIYHVHGFVPQEDVWGQSPFLVISLSDYERRLGDSEALWNQLVRSVLHAKVALFVGLSGDDPAMGPLVTRVRDEIGECRQTGYWLLNDTEENRDKAADLRRRGVVPLFLPGHQCYAPFILGVCQRAAGQLLGARGAP